MNRLPGQVPRPLAGPVHADLTLHPHRARLRVSFDAIEGGCI